MCYAAAVSLYYANYNRAPLPLFGTLFCCIVAILACSTALTLMQFALCAAAKRNVIGIVQLWCVGKRLIQIQLLHSIVSLLVVFGAFAAHNAYSLPCIAMIGSHMLLFFAKKRLLVCHAHRRWTEQVFSELFRLAKRCKPLAASKTF